MKTYTEEQFQNVLDERAVVVARIGAENTKLRDFNYALRDAIVYVLKSKTPDGTDSEFTLSENLRSRLYDLVLHD